MSYLVLARKWRPKIFAEVVGQAHIVRALENALRSDRVHHAYLFAGTRGVGKTTIARILAKALNCETGVTAEPCGKCPACIGVDEGRFVDLIEVDAASRTGVDDMRELLDNVQYMPTSGRFKVYLIDEVHMLSRQSFNALLKTLEEPPPHVKFLFATTDPQKLPITVLSRCLQFNLKRLSARQIVDRMGEICKAEKLKVEATALARLGRAAAGSMRDGLSLLDQAIAFGDEKLADADVAEMLGSMDHHRIVDLIEGLVNGDGADLLGRVRSLDELVPDYETVLDELATALQRIAVIQLAGVDAIEEEEEDVEALQKFAEATDPAFIQLLYQIAVTSRRDLSLAPDSRLGFEMAMLRMVAFRPAGAESAATGGAVSKPHSTSQPGHGKQPARQSAKQSAKQPAKQSAKQPAKQPGKQPAKQPGKGTGKPASSAASSEVAGPVSADAIDDWPGFADSLAIEGAARQLAENTALELASPFELQLSIQRQNEHLLTDKLKSRLVMAIQERVGEGVRVHIEVVEKATKTVAARTAKQTAKTLQETKRAIQEDPNVRDLVDVFGAEVISESVRPGSRSASRE